VCWEAGLTTKRRIMEICKDFRCGGSGVLRCKLFFPLFLWLVAFVFMDSERALLLSGYGILWVSFGFPDLPSVVSHCWGSGMSTICLLAPTH
jgi:hypothetical protein